VQGFALAPDTQPSLFEAARLGSGGSATARRHPGPGGAAGRSKESRPDVLFHLAARSRARHGLGFVIAVGALAFS